MKIAILGYGKMGREIEKIALERGHEIVLKVSDQNLAENTVENISKADIAIEFSSPGSAVENIYKCFEASVPVVCGSTGWHVQAAEVELECKERNASLLYSSNFSIGVNIFFAINKKLAELMRAYPDYEISLREIHHTQKLDAPSGTAISLAEQILANRDDKKGWTDSASATPDMIPILSERIDQVPGTHHVNYRSEIDEIEIVHTAFNRRGFAFGAVAAAEFLQNKKGVYGMQDLLGL